MRRLLEKGFPTVTTLYNTQIGFNSAVGSCPPRPLALAKHKGEKKNLPSFDCYVAGAPLLIKIDCLTHTRNRAKKPAVLINPAGTRCLGPEVAHHLTTRIMVSPSAGSWPTIWAKAYRTWNAHRPIFCCPLAMDFVGRVVSAMMRHQRRTLGGQP